MSNEQSFDQDLLTTDSETSVRVKLAEHKLLLYFVGAIAGTAMIGYVIDIAAGPLNESTKLAHEISGLFGGVAVILTVCGVFLAVLWGSLFLSRKRSVR